jgi:uncharacterized lipoprotein YddW (UPF0748 family)
MRLARTPLNRLASSTQTSILFGTALAGMMAGGAHVATQQQQPQTAVIVPIVLEAPESARRAVASAAASGATVVVIPFSFYASMPEGTAEVLADAHERGLKVVASIPVTVVASALEIPASREHVIYQHPEWLMVSKDLAPTLRRIDRRSPDYVGRLFRWARAHDARLQYLFLSPLTADAVQYAAGTARALVERYAIDGVQLRMAQFPADDFDFSREAVDQFRRDGQRFMTPVERRRMDDIERLDPFAYVTEFPEAWRRFRQDRLTALVAAVVEAVRAGRPGTSVTALIDGDPELARHQFLQDWPSWVQRGLIDGVVRQVEVGASGAVVDASTARPTGAGTSN